MLDPLTALGLAGNVVQLIDYSSELVSGTKQIYQSASGALQANEDSEDLSTHLVSLLTGLSQSQTRWIDAHGSSKLDPDEVRLRNICDRCTEIAIELNLHLQTLKVADGAKRRIWKSAKQALVSVWKKDDIERIAQRLEKYRHEINTHVIIGLRKSAQEADVKNSAQFAALDQQTKSLTLAVLEADSKLDSQADILTKIHQNTSQILSNIDTSERENWSNFPPEITAAPLGDNLRTALHYAAKYGDTLRVRQLLRSPTIDVNARDKYGCSPLHYAMNGDVAKKLLSDKRIEKNSEDNDGCSALHCAVLKRRLDVVKALLEADVDKSLEDDRGNTAAFYARVCPTAAWLLKYGPDPHVRAKDCDDRTGLIHHAHLADLEGVEFFLRHGADINAEDHVGETALGETACNGSANIAEYLLQRGAETEHAAVDEWTPLLRAASFGSLAVAEVLLRYGADMDVMLLDSGNMCLAHACICGHFDVARLLIEAGSSVKARDNSGCTPLLKAASKGDCEMVRWLMNRGADIAAKDHEGRSAVYLAVLETIPDKTTSTIKALLELGATSDDEAKDGHTPITLAAQSGLYDSLKLLLGAGAVYDTFNGRGFSALGEASNAGHVEVVKLLLEYGAKWESVDRNGSSAVSLAAEGGHHAVISVLSASGANSNQKAPFHSWYTGTKFWTPLMHAARGNHHETIRVLADLGADLDAQDSAGCTALFYAALFLHEKSVEILIEKGANVNRATKENMKPMIMAADNHSPTTTFVTVAGNMTPLMAAAMRNSSVIAGMLVSGKADLDRRDDHFRTAWNYAICLAHDADLLHLVEPDVSESNYLRFLQDDQHPSDIAKYLHKRYDDFR